MGGLTIHGHILDSNALPYLFVAYALFFLVIFAYTVSLSRRQSRVQGELGLLRQAVDEERARAEFR